MKRWISAWLIIALCAALCACSSEKEEPKTEEKQQEKQEEASEEPAESSGMPESMPEFETVDLEGNKVTREIFAKTDLTVVNFWATYCSPCIDEMPELGEWSATMPENVQIIGIVVDAAAEDSEEAKLANQIVEKTGADFPHLVAKSEFDDMIAKLIGVPTTFFVDSKGDFVGEPIAGADVDGYKEYVGKYLDAKSGTGNKDE